VPGRQVPRLAAGETGGRPRGDSGVQEVGLWDARRRWRQGDPFPLKQVAPLGEPFRLVLGVGELLARQARRRGPRGGPRRSARRPVSGAISPSSAEIFELPRSVASP